MFKKLVYKIAAIKTEDDRNECFAEIDKAFDNDKQERVDALCAGLDLHVQVCEINHPMDPIRLGVNWSAIGAVPADQAAACGAAISKAADLASNFCYTGYMLEY